MEHMNLALAAMQAQFENQALFHAGAQQANMQSADPSFAAMMASQNLAQSLAGVPGTAATRLAAVLTQQQKQLDAGSSGSTSSSTREHKSKATLAAEAAQAAAARQGAAKLLEQERKEKEDSRRDEQKREEETKQKEIEKNACHLHKKPMKKCKFCKRYEEFMAAQKPEVSSSRSEYQHDQEKDEEDEKRRRGQLELANTKTFGFSPLLITHIVDSTYYKSTLVPLDSFEQVLDEMYQFADSVKPYMDSSALSTTTPSCVFCLLHKLLTLGLKERQLRKLVDYFGNTYIRCVGFLFIRFGLVPEVQWQWLGEYVLDNEEFRIDKHIDQKTTIGEWVECLLNHEKYYQTVLPRLPVKLKQGLEAKLAPIAQYRKRTRANLEILDAFREPGLKIEVCLDGEWWSGTILEVVDEHPSRIKFKIRLEDDNTEEVVHLGKVIIAKKRGSQKDRKGSRSRSRSRDRGNIDWSRLKGKSEHDLVEELRGRERDKAVCSSGKEYSHRPLSYDASCYWPQKSGSATARLMEQEMVHSRSSAVAKPRRTSPSPERSVFAKQPSQEHQERMQKLYEKYSVSKPASSAPAKNDEIERPDVMRLG